MNSLFGDVFLFLTDLAWKSRITIPAILTTVFLIMDIRLQIEINIQSGQVAAAELELLDHETDEEYTTDSDDNGEDEDYDDYTEEESEDRDSNANRLRGSLGIGGY